MQQPGIAQGLSHPRAAPGRKPVNPLLKSPRHVHRRTPFAMTPRPLPAPPPALWREPLARPAPLWQDRRRPCLRPPAGAIRRATMYPARSAPTAAAPDRTQRDEQLARWLRQAAEGDASAFERFHDATAGYAHALARRLLREADVDDVLADSYFQAWREAPRFDPARGSAVTWLLCRVHSRAIDLRRQQRRDGLSDPGPDALAHHASELPGPDELLALAEAGTRLAAALAGLSSQERWVLGLAYFRELSHAATAEATGLPLGTVKSLLLRAQQKLRMLLADPPATPARR